MNLDHLLWFGDLIPLTVGLPTFGYHLHQHFPHRRVRHVGSSLLVGSHVHFKLFVLDQVLINRFHVHAGVFHRLICLAARHFNRDSIPRRGRLVLLGRRCLILLRRPGRGHNQHSQQYHRSHPPVFCFHGRPSTSSLEAP